MMEFQERISGGGGQRYSILGHLFTLESNYARHSRCESQVVPIILPGHAWHLVTSMVGSHTWYYHLIIGHLFFQRVPKLSISLESPPPPPPSSQFMMKNYFWYPTIIKNVTEGWAWHTWGKHWEYKPLLGDNGQSLFPLGISLIPSPLSKLCSSLTLSWGPPSETLLKTASAPHPLPTPFLSAITFINIQDTLQSTCLVYLLFTSFFSHQI